MSTTPTRALTFDADDLVHMTPCAPPTFEDLIAGWAEPGGPSPQGAQPWGLHPLGRIGRVLVLPGTGIDDAHRAVAAGMAAVALVDTPARPARVAAALALSRLLHETAPGDLFHGATGPGRSRPAIIALAPPPPGRGRVTIPHFVNFPCPYADPRRHPGVVMWESAPANTAQNWIGGPWPFMRHDRLVASVDPWLRVWQAHTTETRSNGSTRSAAPSPGSCTADTSVSTSCAAYPTNCASSARL